MIDKNDKMPTKGENYSTNNSREKLKNIFTKTLS